MKFHYCLFFLWLCIIHNIASQSLNYGEGNGAIIQENESDQYKTITRKHIQRIKIGDLAYKDRLIIYSKPKQVKNMKIGTLKINNYINISKILKIIEKKSNTYSIWLKITTDDQIEGWIYLAKSHQGYPVDPYRDESWSILEILEGNDHSWTVRKLETQVARYVEGEIEIFNSPGSHEKQGLYIFNPENTEYSIKVLAITEEKDTINGIEDHWIKIVDDQGNIGWIFGGYTFAGGRGGYKFYKPDYIIYGLLGDYGNY